MILTTPRRRTTLHFTHIFLTDERTFMSPYRFLTIRPRVMS